MHGPLYAIAFLLCHLVGDYILQSDWMALNKSKRTWPCLVHVLIYTSCFLILTTSWKALLFIGVTHFIFDRFPIIIRRLIWLKNHLGPGLKFVPFDKCSATGYYDTLMGEIRGIQRPIESINGYFPRLNYITIWLYIITDNILHLGCNLLALTLFGTTI
jgi:Protein of unknown function (DUF3307)